MSRWYRLVLPGLFLAAQFALTAQNLDDAARDLARQVISAAGSRDPVFLSLRNLSSLGADAVTKIRDVLEGELRAQGLRLADRPSNPELRLTLSENLNRYLLVGQLRRGEEQQVFMTSMPRREATAEAATDTFLVIEKKLVWEQDDPILDLALVEHTDAPANLLVLDPQKVTLYAHGDNGWQAQRSQNLPAATSWPRDPRGRLVVNAVGFQVYIPGTVCRGLLQPSLNLECKDSSEGWPLDSGTRLLGLADVAPGRNHF
ncbi:MAG TPA: hypothetical protein VG672_18545, partial [Bryobacteraceae bacterium]|nr:hypothetical protein [Bryobacteraceae bacterium]